MSHDLTTRYTALSVQELLLRPLVFWRPLRLVDPTSWVPHIPFAFWLIGALRPRTVVELGTMTGNSFAAMAQAVQTLGLESACYAIDTWKGDPHTGFYGEEVFQEWSGFHDQHFGAFSRIVRSTFDEALGQFEAGSVDLLHIDGFHSYDAVHHDFDSWLSKLSSRAVVLLHDTNVRERDFGVWRFWEELCKQYPCFTFLHGHGLGIAGVGRDLPADVRALVEEVPRHSQETVLVRQFFGTLGEALLNRPREVAQARREAELRGETEAIAAERDRLAGLLAQRDLDLMAAQGEASRLSAVHDLELKVALREISRLSAVHDAKDLELKDAQSEISCLSAAQATKELELKSAQSEILRLSAAHDTLASALAEAERSQPAAMEQHAQLEEQLRQHRAALETIERESGALFTLLMRLRQSRSWRVTAPLRLSTALVRGLVNRVRPQGRQRSTTMPLMASLRPSVIRLTRLIRRSGLFDEPFYLRHLSRETEHCDIAAAWAEPLLHYLLVGAYQGADPHPLFDSSFYLECNPDVAQAGINPLVHYLVSGGLEGRDPHPLFQSAFYLKQNLDVAASKMNPLVHFLSHGSGDGRDPNPWFATSFYVAADPGLRASGENPLVHFIRVGAAEGRPAGPLFDTAYYLRANPDVARAGLNPLTHYILSGRAEGRHASPAATATAAGDVRSSTDAYDAVMAGQREFEAERLRKVVVTPPQMVTLPERGDLRSHLRGVVLAAQSSPEVSIIVPILNAAKLTLECLLSIVRFSEDVRFEVIIVDNGSTDGSPELFSSIPHLKYVRHEQNQGFARGCNSGAEVARGRYLVFLNNDAQAQPGSLSALLQTFSEFDNVGAVGPKVLFPDGRLQDAGSAVNSDCTSSLIGVFDDPNLPRYNISREVEYVSAVCLMIDAEHFKDLGGFDVAFSPAYCEDVDLCLRLRRQGLRIVYQPSAVIVHHLSVTSGELGPSFKMAAVTRNQQELSVRHQAQIEALDRTRIIALYLPQFHPIPENDVWWGKGFTEWRNVTRARPNFEGHCQPRLPADLGFYDLRLAETYAHQVELAERYGVSGFCFYYYWFDGRRLLERPLERLLEGVAPEFPFCLCWANESWTRRWDGAEYDVLMAQSYREEDDLAIIDDLIRYVDHPAYIRVEGRPLLLIYRADLFPDVRRTVQTWRTRCRTRGVGEIYLAMVESFGLSRGTVSPMDWGFDAGIEFPPHEGGLFPVQPNRLLNPDFRGRVFDYQRTALHYMTRALPGYRRFRTVMPAWDNTPRRQDDAVIFANSTPGAYQAWLECVLRQTREQHFGDERLVFINAWNEWAEGAYMEPDLAWGHAYLEATRDARDNVRLGLCSR